jgi:hypothetical protein
MLHKALAVSARRNSLVIQLAIALCLSAALPHARATVLASGTLSELATLGGTNTFTMTLQNTSTAGESLEMFWFAWIPGENFLTTTPVSVQAPTGWSDSVMGSTGNGVSIQFNLSGGTALAAGSTLSGFNFTTIDTLASMATFSTAHPTQLTTESEVGTQPADAGTKSAPFVIAVVPEPNSIALIGIAGAAFVCLRKRRRRG